MHILYIHQYFTTPEKGGGTRSFEFAKRFCEAGHQVTMLTGSSHDGQTDFQLLPGLRVLSTNTAYANRMSYSQRKIQFLKFAFSSSLKKVGRPDVVLATSTPLTVAIPALVYKRSNKIPMLFEVRDLWPEAPIQLGALTNPILKAALRKFEKFVYHQSDHIVALSPGMEEGISKCGIPNSKITLIPNASDLDVFTPGPVSCDFLREMSIQNRPTVCYTGALGEANGIPLLIDTAKLLAHRQTNVQIIVAGEGRYRELIEKEATKLNNLIFLGQLSKSNIARLYRSSVAGLVLFKRIPILQTNSPNKFFDLLAAGRPVITNMTGWIKEIVDQYKIGQTVDDSPESLAAAIEAASVDSDFDKKAERSRNLAGQRFDRDKLAAQYRELLERLAAREL